MVSVRKMKENDKNAKQTGSNRPSKIYHKNGKMGQIIRLDGNMGWKVEQKVVTIITEQQTTNE